MGTPDTRSNPDGNIERQGHTTNGMHGDVPNARDGKRGTATPQKISTKKS